MKLQTLFIAIFALGLIAGCGQPAATTNNGTSATNDSKTTDTKSTDTKTLEPAAFKESMDGVLEEAKASNKLVMIDLWATWCGPCKALQSEVFPQPEVQERFKNLLLVKLDTDKEEGQKMGQKFGVEAIPVCLFLDGDGKEVYRINGNMPTAQFVAELDKALAKKS
ncbi:MAG: thioredoxin family protein [Fimbriimonadales bacterium]